MLLEVARGVPRSFPFHAIALHFSPSDSPRAGMPSPDLESTSTLMRAGVDIGAGHPTTPGVNVKDSWWVNGRNRYVRAMRIVEPIRGKETSRAAARGRDAVRGLR